MTVPKDRTEEVAPTAVPTEAKDVKDVGHSHPVSLWNVTEGGRGIWHACKGIESETHVCLLFMLSILSHLVCNHI